MIKYFSLFASFLLSNPNLQNLVSADSNGSPTSASQQEEHNLIANYCSRLANYYAQNPHLSPSPPSTASMSSPPPPPTPHQPIYSQPPAQPQMGIQQLSRTSSLSRQQAISGSSNGLMSRSNLKYSTLRPNAQLGTTTSTNGFTGSGAAANRSMSESNFANNDDSDGPGDYSLDDRLLKEKREIVAKLEKQNREIAKEIKRLRLKQQQSQSAAAQVTSNQCLDYSQMDSSDYAALAQQLMQQRGVSNYSTLYTTGKSRETTPAGKNKVDLNLIAELRSLKVSKSISIKLT